MNWGISESKDSDGVVFEHKVVETKSAKWLCIEFIYEKLARPNCFDIGGTVDNHGIADYWFMMKTEQSCNDIFLLHLFVSSHSKNSDTSFNISVSASSDFKLDNQRKSAILTNRCKEYNFENIQENSYNYITTYQFSALDADLLKDIKTLLMPVSITFTPKKLSETSDAIKLSHDLGFLLKNPLHSDFTIELPDGTKFPVHKAILITHSEVFKAMLKEDTAENIQNTVLLEDIEKNELQLLLQFIYTGTIKDLDKCNWVQLLKLADQYNIQTLVELCCHALAQKMDKDNVFTILYYSDIYNADKLKILALEFIKGNTSILYNTSFKQI